MKQHCHRVHTTLTLAILLFSLVFSLASVQPVAAQSGTWYVSTTGSDVYACNTPESPCLTINTAIAKAADGDTVKVAIGTYTSDAGDEVVLIDKSTTLSGGWNETFTTQSGISTIDGGGQKLGIEVYSRATTTVEYFSIQNGFQPYSYIGGISSRGVLTVNHSSIVNNQGVGIENYGTLTLNNSTVSGNPSGVINGDTAIITNSTIHNLLYTSGTLTFQNTIVNTCSSDGIIISRGHNLIRDTTDCPVTPTTGDLFNVDPQLGPLVEQTGTYPLASSSPAIDAGDNATCFGETDQRGQPRVDGPDADSKITCDIGAYEYVAPGEPDSIHSISGGGQRTPPFMTFSKPLKARVLDNQGTPVEGIEVLFTAPIDGASGTFKGGGKSISVFADRFGIATAPPYTANSQYGEYVVTASTSGLADTAEFRLENGGWYVSPSGSDTNDCKFFSTPCRSINAAVAKAANRDTVMVAVGTYRGSGTEEVVQIDNSITLSGGWNETFTTQSGTSMIDGGGAKRGITVLGSSYAKTVVIDHFTIQNGFRGKQGSGGGIYNGRNNTLTLSNSIVRRNVSEFGGGGIYNYEGTLTINNTTISQNSTGKVNTGSDGGGGILSRWGVLILDNSTVSGNKIISEVAGSGIYTYYDEKVILNNSTVSGNTGSHEGIYISSGTLFLNNSTITNNQFRGITNSGGTIMLQNTIIAKNGPGGDCANFSSQGGKITSKGYNLISNNTGCPFTPAIGDLVGTSSNPIDPKLAPLQDNGGPTFTHALNSDSPAVDAGNPAKPGSGGNACLLTDQRGVTRPKGAACDIGAYERPLLQIIPALHSPKGIITDTTPTFKWEQLNKATKYQYQLLKGTEIIYTQTVPASACGATQCANTPTTILGFGAYRWQVRAFIGGEWKSYSPTLAFKLFPAKPGYWQGQGLDFYVTNAGPKVDNFKIYIKVLGCGTRMVTHSPLLNITKKKFSFTGSFYANGIFITPIQASGKMGLNRFYIPGCGYVSGGPFSWTAVWKNGSQPTMLVEETDDFSVILIPDLQLAPELQIPFDAFTVEPVE